MQTVFNSKQRLVLYAYHLSYIHVGNASHARMLPARQYGNAVRMLPAHLSSTPTNAGLQPTCYSLPFSRHCLSPVVSAHPLSTIALMHSQADIHFMCLSVVQKRLRYSWHCMYMLLGCHSYECYFGSCDVLEAVLCNSHATSCLQCCALPKGVILHQV